MAETKYVEYDWCCPRSLWWVIIGALLLISGLTSLLYITDLLPQTEVELLGAILVVVLGIYILAQPIRFTKSPNQ
ncbi:MAG: hypothetical protein ACE5R6_17480 [Candidatus Heimdallarchaeota archaeon]